MAADVSCLRCLGKRWVCERHPDQGWPHLLCPAAGEPCPICNAGSIVADPSDFTPNDDSEDRMSDTAWRDQNALTSDAPTAPGEVLFEFRLAPDRDQIRCELRHRGEMFGWEVLFIVGDEVAYSRAAFPTRAIAIIWADVKREALIKREAGTRAALEREGVSRR